MTTHLISLLASPLTDWIGYLIAAACSGGLSWIFTMKYSRQQAKSDAMKSVQDVYQELLEDLRKDRENLKSENDRLRSSLDGITRRMNNLEAKCSDNERKVQEQERRIQGMLPLLCYDMDCKVRCSTKKELSARGGERLNG